MRKTGNKKKEISKSKRTIAICLSMVMMLGSVSYLAFADENTDEPAAEEAVVAEAEPAEAAPAIEAPADEEEPAAEPETAEAAEAEAADVEETAEDAEPAAEETAAEETVTIPAETVEEEVSVRSYGVAVGDIIKIGDALPTDLYCSAMVGGQTTVFQFRNTTLPKPTGSNVYGSYRWRFANVTANRQSMDLYGQEKAVEGIKITGGRGSRTSPLTFELVYHEHSWDLTTRNQVVTISCTAAHCDIQTYPTVTLNAPAGRNITYNGEKHEATSSTRGSVPGLDIGIEINYTGVDREGTEYDSTEAPVDAGDYTATMTVTVGEKSASVSTNFTIHRARISTRGIDEPAPIDDSELTDLGEIILPEGEKVDLCVAGEEVEGAVFVYSTDGETFSEEIPTADATGDYTVSYKLQPDKNHTLSAEVSDTIDVTVMNYEIVEGADATWQLDSTDNVVISVKRSTADDQTIDRFTELTIDDAALAEDTDFTKEAGSVVLTIKAEALQKLSAGEHTVKIGFVEGIELEAKITIKAAPAPAPQTGEYAGAFVLVIGAVMAAAGAAFVFKAKKA